MSQDTMPHWAERSFECAGMRFTITMGQEGEGLFIVGLLAHDGTPGEEEYIDDTGRETLEEAQELFNNPPLDRIERWVNTRQAFDVLG
jgi:hypothetical protein